MGCDGILRAGVLVWSDVFEWGMVWERAVNLGRGSDRASGQKRRFRVVLLNDELNGWVGECMMGDSCVSRNRKERTGDE